VGKISSGGIEDAGLVACGWLALLIDRAKAAEGDAESKTQVIGWRLWVELFDVFGERGAFRSIYGLLGPFLRMTPRGCPRMPKLDRRLTTAFMSREAG
jgi:hypothetical protein